MKRAIKAWLQESQNGQGTSLDELIDKLSCSYTIYGCMLLLPAQFLENEQWCRRRLVELDTSTHLDSKTRLYELLAQHLKATHIAVNSPIPPRTEDGQAENVLRAPTNFTPIYGDFGPTTCASPPTNEDFYRAFWVTAKQNGISQVWAPRWTMFSRGNIGEKARLLTLPSIAEAVHQGKRDGRGCAAVDLYVGIGYFAFSYLRAGVARVVCWDINPWSIEGLRRGAAANKWSQQLWSDSETDDTDEDNRQKLDARLLVFCESNLNASRRIDGMRQQLPPIRHVNCGLLPTSKESWGIAMRALDPELGGWIHVHENFGIKEIEEKAEEVRLAFRQMTDQTGGREIVVEYINRVKSYAPGVMHCVIDLYVAPPNPG